MLALGVIATTGSFVVESSYRGRAQLVQRVQRDPGAELFGDRGTPLGSPQELIIDDPKAFVEGTGEGGAKLVDDKYLTDHKIYPLQLKSITFITSMIRWASLADIVLALILLRMRRFGRR